MKKYRLAKDLPFAKAGTEVFQSANAFVVKDPKYQGQVLYIGELSDRDKLIEQGWIEEVKLREWDVVVNKSNDVIGYGNFDKTITEQYRLQNHEDRLDDFEIIHVQEID